MLTARQQEIWNYLVAYVDNWTGDTLDRVVTWKGKSDVSSLAGKAIRLRMVMSEADLFSLRFGE